MSLRLRTLLFLLGAALLTMVVAQVGVNVLIEQVRALSWQLPLLLIPYVFVTLLDTLGWKYAFGAQAATVRFGPLLASRIAGEAVNLTTPSASLAGEPIKAYLLQRWIPLDEGIASVVIAKTIITLAQIPFAVSGVALIVFVLALPPTMLWSLVVTLIVGTVATLALYRLQLRGMFRWLLGVLDRLRCCPAFLDTRRPQLLVLDRRIARFYRSHPREFGLSFAFHLLGWVTQSLEVYFALWLLGFSVTVADAIAIEVLASVLKSVAFMVPGNLGVQEGGNVVIFAAFGLGAGTGLTFSLVRRLRELLFCGLGWLILLLLAPGASTSLASSGTEGKGEGPTGESP